MKEKRTKKELLAEIEELNAKFKEKCDINDYNAKNANEAKDKLKSAHAALDGLGLSRFVEVESQWGSPNKEELSIEARVLSLVFNLSNKPTFREDLIKTESREVK